MGEGKGEQKEGRAAHYWLSIPPVLFPPPVNGVRVGTEDAWSLSNAAQFGSGSAHPLSAHPLLSHLCQLRMYSPGVKRSPEQGWK